MFLYLESFHDVECSTGVEASADAVHQERRLRAADHLAWNTFPPCIKRCKPSQTRTNKRYDTAAVPPKPGQTNNSSTSRRWKTAQATWGKRLVVRDVPQLIRVCHAHTIEDAKRDTQKIPSANTPVPREICRACRVFNTNL